MVRAATGLIPGPVERDLRRLLVAVSASWPELLTLRSSAGASGGDAADALATWLYQQWYLSCAAAPTGTAGTLHPDLPALFRAAVPSTRRFLRGWVALDARGYGWCLAGRRGQTRELRAGEYVNISRPGVPVMPGDGLAVTERVDRVDEQSGFWTTRSADGEPAQPLVRLYWSVDADAAPAVLADVVSTLEKCRIRYSLKCPSRAADFTRSDSLVLYLERAAWPSARLPLTAAARRSGPRLRTCSPPLTRRIAMGVSFAEDPGGDESYGQSRCRALAPGVLRMLSEGRPAGNRALDYLLAALRQARIDPEQPWLRARSRARG